MADFAEKRPEPGPGGHHGHRAKDRRRVICAVITVSDTRTEADDKSGSTICDLVEKAGHTVGSRVIVPDDPETVTRLVRRLSDEGEVEAILLNGGTGVAPRDNTYEAVEAVLTKRIDGFGELFRMLSWEEVGAASMISRAVAGLAGDVAVFSMPGSTAACRLAMTRLILPELGHVVGLARPKSAS